MHCFRSQVQLASYGYFRVALSVGTVKRIISVLSECLFIHFSICDVNSLRVKGMNYCFRYCQCKLQVTEEVGYIFFIFQLSSTKLR